MNLTRNQEHRGRVLVIDDNPAILDDFRKILLPNALDVAAAELEGRPGPGGFDVQCAGQGESGVDMARQALAEGSPFAVVFVDIRMPPGWDGVETARRLWTLHPDAQIVICTAYSDYSWEELSAALPRPDQLLILKKPFDVVEVVQLTHALVEKWRLLQLSKGKLAGLEQTVLDRNRELEASHLAALNMMADAVEARRTEEAANEALRLQIAEREAVQRDLDAERQLLRTLIDNLPAYIYIKDREGRYLVNNLPHIRFLGAAEESSVKGKTIYDFFPPDVARAYEADDLYVLSSGQPVIGREEPAEVQGQSRWFSTIKVPLRDRDGTISGLVGITLDITDRRRLEEEFRQSQKMEAFGQLAGGVAHDFNNILLIIMMQASLAGDMECPPAVQSMLMEIRTAAERAATLTRQLLAFSRRQVMQPRQVDLNETVGALSKMLQRIVNEDIALQFEFCSRPLLTCADPGMLDQVLLNLVVNARDALPQGGRIVIRTGHKALSPAEAAAIQEAAPGEYVYFRVEDNGIGIPPEILPRIFEPFFTTKDQGKGTGLGLATVFGIVRQHGGYITVESKPGQGTAFEICLPTLAHQPEDAANPPGAGLPIPGGSETILLVEDELPVRQLSRLVLERSGYKVIEAADGVEALKVWDRHQKEIDLLLTDMVMPAGVSGRALALCLLSQRPDLKVIFTSGYSADIAGHELTLQEGQNFIAKPFTSEQLLRTLRSCLDGVRPAK